MSRAFLAALLIAGCTFRAPIPPPRLPLAATPAEALPGPPTEDWPDAPFELRLTRRELSNGFRLILARGEPNGVVSVAFASRATPRWDRRSTPVITGWMASMLFRATRTDEGVVDDLLTREGFSPSLDLDAMGVIVAETMPREDLPRFVRALDQSLRAPVFRSEDLARRIEAHTDRVEGELSGSAGILDDRAPSLLYAEGDPRAQGMSDRLPQIQALDVATLEARHADLLDPSRSALVITGDLDPAVLLPFLGRVFGAWSARDAAPDVVPPQIRDGGVRARVLVRPTLRAYLRLVDRAPPFTHPDYPAFLVLEQLLGGMFASRLNVAIREGEGASYGFHARYGANATEGSVELETSVDPGYTRRALDAMLAELRRVRGESGGIEARELAVARTRARELLLARVDYSLGLALAIARRVQIDQEPGAFGDVLRRLDALDARAVEAAARNWLRPDRAPLLLVVRPEHLDAIRDARLGDLEIVRVRYE